MNSQWYLKAMPLNNAKINVPTAHRYYGKVFFPIWPNVLKDREKYKTRLPLW